MAGYGAKHLLAIELVNASEMLWEDSIVTSLGQKMFIKDSFTNLHAHKTLNHVIFNSK